MKLLQLRRHDEMDVFIRDTVRRGVRIAAVDTAGLEQVAQRSRDYWLDFDDAYQYVAAEVNSLTIVSFDADFDRTPLGRRTSAAAMTP